MVEDYFQLKSEWQRVGETQGAVLFHHRYSRETAEQRILVAAPMRELEHFTAREAYSFPACPRVYKCATLANYCTGNTLHVDLALLVESLSCSLALASDTQKKQVARKLEKQMGHLVSGFQYLCRRYGPFLVSQNLIFWNSYGMARVWLSSNTLENQPHKPVENEGQMIASLIKLLQQCLELRFREKATSFKGLADVIDRGQYDRMDVTRRVKFERLQEGRNSQLSDVGNRLLSVSKIISHVNSNVSIESKPSGKQLAASFQFDIRRKTRLRSRLSSEKESRVDQSLAVDMNCGSKGLQIQKKMQDQEQSEKENAEPLRRKESKMQTCLLGTHTPSHSRRYSKPINLSHTQECFPNRRKSSLLREELLSQFDGLFRSNSEVSFDSLELQKELQGVL